MKQIHYKIFRGEKSNVVKVTIPEDLFEFLDQKIFYFAKTELVSPDTLKSADFVIGKFLDTHYDILYDVLQNTTGIETSEIEDLTVEDYEENKIIVHVYLDMR